MKEPRTHLPKYNVGAHFLTAKTFQNTPYFRHPECARIFCQELETARAKYGFLILAFVVMPDHIHLLVWWDTDALPDLSISKIAWAVKGLSARRIVQYLQGVEEEMVDEGKEPVKERVDEVDEGHTFAYPLSQSLMKPTQEPRNQPHYRNWRYKIWQQGAGYDFNIYTPKKLVEKVAYIHANPIRAGLASRPDEYPWSSAANYGAAEGGVAEGIAFGYPVIHPVQITHCAEVL